MESNLSRRLCRAGVADEWSLIVQSAEEEHMQTNLDKFRAKARLLLATERLRDLIQFLERDIPALIAEVEGLQRELAEARRYDAQAHLQHSEASRASSSGEGASQLLSTREFAHEIGVSEACVRRWTLLRKVNVVRLGRLVRIPRTEIRRLMDEGTVPARSF